jgi:hypothetical protein
MATKRKTKAEKAREARIEKAYGKVGHGRPVPIFSLTAIWKRAEEALDAAAKLPLTDAEVEVILEAALDDAIKAVEVKS